MPSGIYKIINLMTNDFYLGSSIDLDNRFRQHLYLLKKNKHTSIKLQRVWNKYGKDNFIFHVIEYCPEQKCLEFEEFYLNSFECKYNIAISASAPMTNRKHSEKTKAKYKGRKVWNKGIPRTPEEKALMGERRSLVYQNMTKEQKITWAKLKSETSPKYWLGKNISQESKNKISNHWKNKNDYIILCEQNNKTYLTQLEISKDLKIHQGHISEHLKGQRLNVKGYTFKKVKRNV